jgi:hypothetical protein
MPFIIENFIHRSSVLPHHRFREHQINQQRMDQVYYSNTDRKSSQIKLAHIFTLSNLSTKMHQTFSIENWA